MRWVIIVSTVVGLLMANNFVPIKDGDWQALNIAIEDLFYSKGRVVDAKTTKVPNSKKGIPDNTQEKTIDGSTGIGFEPIDVIGVPDDLGNIDIYGRGDTAPDVGVPDTGRIHDTLAGKAVASSYFLDLRSHRNSNTVRHITVDYLVLRDSSSPAKTLALQNVDVACDISVAGPIVNGRDQVGAFSAGWVNFYVIYNVSTETTRSIVSSSATAPTLPSGYTYYVRTGADYWDTSALQCNHQMGDIIWKTAIVIANQAPSVAGTREAISLSAFVPPTVKSVMGYFGTTTNHVANLGMSISSNSSAENEQYVTVLAGNVVSQYAMRGAYFHIPLDAQELYWRGSSTDSVYGINVSSFIDDI